MNNTTRQLEALLFYKGEPMGAKEIAGLLRVSESDIREAAKELGATLVDRGITLIERDGTYLLVTSPECAKLLEDLRREELSKELSKASVETMAIIAYRGKATRAEIDYIRGVNSSFILRNLLIRGLIEKEPNPRDARTYLYRPSVDLLRFMGARNEAEFPSYEKYHAELDTLLAELVSGGSEATPDEAPLQ